MGIETELKFRVPQRSLQILRHRKIPGSSIGERSEIDLRSIYFDTPKLKLKRHGLSLRVRKDGDKHVQTVKAAAPACFGRGEWETEIHDGFPDLGKARDTPLKQIGSKKLRRKLKPIFETAVHRTVVPVHTRRSEIELAFDSGNIKAGRSSRAGGRPTSFSLQRRWTDDRKPNSICDPKRSEATIWREAGTSRRSLR